MNYTAQILINVMNADGVDNEYLEQIKQQVQEYLSFEGETVTVAIAVQEPMVDNVGVPTIKASPPEA